MGFKRNRCRRQRPGQYIRCLQCWSRVKLWPGAKVLNIVELTPNGPNGANATLPRAEVPKKRDAQTGPTTANRPTHSGQHTVRHNVKRV